MPGDSSRLFLALYGHVDRQRVVFEARAINGQIVTRQVKPGTEENVAGHATFYRASFFVPNETAQSATLLTTFDLIPDANTVSLAGGKLELKLGVRYYQKFVVATTVESYLSLGAKMAVQNGSIAFERLTFSAQDGPFSQASVENFNLSKIGEQSWSLTAHPPVVASGMLLPAFLGIEAPRWVDFNRPLGIRFQEFGDDGLLCLTVTQALRLRASQEVKIDFPAGNDSLSLKREQESEWSFVQRAPNSPVRADEAPDNRWEIEVTCASAGARELFARWNDKVAQPYLEALRSVRAGSRVTVIPVFDAVSKTWPLRSSFEFREPKPTKGHFLRSAEIAIVREGAAPSGAPRVLAIPRALSPASAGDRPIHTCLYGLTSHEGKPLRASWRLLDPAQNREDADAPAVQSGLVFRAQHLSGPPGSKQVVRFGSLDLDLPAPLSDSALAPSVVPLEEVSTFLGDVVRDTPPSGTCARPLDFSIVRLHARLHALRARPGGQDAVPGDEFVKDDAERRELPVIIPLGPSDDAGGRNFLLALDEETTRSESQTLKVGLRDLGKTAALAADENSGQGVVVIDRHPFLVARVNVPPLRGEEDDTEVANWSGDGTDGPSWEVRIGDSFTLELPPQGLGEAMEKRPGAIDVAEGKAADFRFTPPARFELQPSFFAQRFADAPWNLRRHLGFPGQRDPGAGIDSFRFELLYGLEGKVEAPFLRLAEIASRLGHLPDAVPSTLPWQGTPQQQEAFVGFRKDWDGVRRSYRSRLAVLEPFDEQRVDEATGEVVIERQITYRLRTTAELKYPILKKAGEEWKVEDLPPDLPKALKDLHRGHPESGLAGGVTWPFESKNVYSASFRKPESTSGKLARAAFSALGGWGFQKASFDKDRTTFYSDTAMGRSFSISLERIGRIGVYWHPAKHVIVYERTVAPTEQFADKQDSHLGRPLLRKVREYVEILEPTRRYPEFGAPPVTRGFVTGCTFKSRIMAVDSDWGADVGTIGWQIPLWRPADGALKPQVYPKPQIVLEVAVDPDTGSAVEQCEIEEPEKLVFYTDTRETTDSRTDLWPAIEGIDFLDQPKPVPPGIPGYAGGNLDLPLPDAPAVEAGYDRFTLAVAPAARPANLVAERTDQALSAALRNVTMMRSAARELSDRIPQAVRELSRLPDHAEALLQGVLAAVPTGGKTTQELIDSIKKAVDNSPVGGLAAQLGSLRDPSKFPAEALAIGQKFCERLAAQSKVAVDRLKGEISDLRRQARTELPKKLDPLRQSPESVRVEAKKFFAPPFDRGRQWLDEAQVGLDRLEDHKNRIFAVVEDLETEVKAEVDASIARLGGLILKSQKDLARAREEVRGLRARLAASLRQADSKLAGISDPKFGRIASRVREKLAEIALDLDSTLAEAERTLDAGTATLETLQAMLAEIRTKVDQSHEAIRQAVADLIRPVDAVLTQLEAAVDGAGSALDGLHRKIDTEIDDFADSAGGSLDALMAAIDQSFEDLQQTIGERIDAAAGAVTVAVTGICKEILQSVGDSLSLLDNAVAGVRQRIKNALDGVGVGKSIEELRRAIEREVDGLRSDLLGFADQARHEVLDPLRKALGDGIFQVGDSTLRLLRAFGEAPIVPSLGFNRRQIAYFFDELKNAVDITPVTALFNRLGDDLKALGIRLPTSALGGRLLPDSLESLDLSKILPDFSGLKLDNLFPGLRMPAFGKDRIKVTHGVDRQTRRAWAQADVDVPFDESIDVFSTGAVTVRLLRSAFKAQARLQAGADGAVDHSLKGELSGSWQIAIADKPLVVFRDTALRFADGRVRFDLSPEKIEFTEALRFLVDLMKSLQLSGDYLTIEFLEDDGVPIGVQSVLDLPLPDLSAGAFALSNLRLGVTFALTVKPGDGGVDFELSTRLHLGTKDVPFTLAISLLTGGGWLDTRARYLPRTGEVDSFVSIGMVAGASLAFRFGPIHGGVWVLFGIEVEYRSQLKTGSSAFAVAIFLLVRGQVQVLFLTVDLRLLLEARYEGSGRLVGTGSLSITIKMGWFFKVTVSTSVRYVFSEGGGQNKKMLTASIASDPILDAAKAYLGMLA